MRGARKGIETAPRRRALLALAGDERLAKQAQAGDQAALEAIFRRYEQDLYRFCMGILGEPQDAQDALQNTMVKVLRALPGERRKIKLKPWLYRVAHNEAVELRRRQRPAEPLAPETVALGASLEDQAEGGERLRRLLEDMAELPQRQRAALVMRELSGLEFSEIGAALGTSSSAVRQALYEARRGLQEMRLGREMRCEEATRVLSDQDGSPRGHRDVRAHLRHCPECRLFQSELDDRKQALAAISPLPAVVAVALTKGVLGSSAGVGAGLGAGAAGSGALGGGVVATSAGVSGVAKSAAAILAVVAFGTAAADHSGLVHLGSGGRPSGNGAVKKPRAALVAAPAGRVRVDARGLRGAGGRGGHASVAGSTGARPRGRSAAQGRTASLTAATVASGPEAPAAADSPPQARHAEAGKGDQDAWRVAKSDDKKPAKDHPSHPAHSPHPAHPPHPAHAANPEPGAKTEAAAASETATSETPRSSRNPQHPAQPEQPQKSGGRTETAAAPAATPPPAEAEATPPEAPPGKGAKQEAEPEVE